MHSHRLDPCELLVCALAGVNCIPLPTAKARDGLGGWSGPAVYELVSGSGGGLVLLNDARGDTPPLADRDALAFRPRPDVAAVLPA